VKRLDSVNQSWAILLVEEIRSYLDLQVWPHRDEMPIKGPMVKPAKGEPVTHDWLP